MTTAWQRAGPAATATLDVTSPWDGALVGTAPNHEPAGVATAVAQAEAVARSLEPVERAGLLRAAARELEARAGEFAALITAEAGLCRRDSDREVARACRNLVVAAEEATRIRGETVDLSEAAVRKLAITVREPAGVVAAITPFNRPLNQVVVKVAPALAAGNAVVVKPSDKAPLSALAFVELLRDVGCPAGLVAAVCGKADVVGPALVTDPRVDMVAFTGSPSTGRRVAALAAGRRLLLELGGNDPLVVLDDADLDHAARIAVEQAFSTSGQSCRGIKRVIAVDAIADALAERITALARPLSWGDPADPRTDVGPLIDEAAATVVERRCAVAVAAGARVLLGGRREGALHPPMVLDHVPADAELVVHETFGPVLPMIRVRSLDDAITVANGTSYGLQAGVITDSVDRFRVIAARLRVAAVNLLDGPAYESPHIPFGGVKGSGYGREGIRWGIEEMSVVKTITMPWGS